MTIRRTNTRQQGDLGLVAAIHHYVSVGYDVALPVGESQPWDLIVEDREDRRAGPKRVQVKTTTRRARSDGFEVQLATRGGNRSWNGTAKVFDREVVEVLFVLADELDRYAIPTAQIEARHALVLGEKWRRFLICGGQGASGPFAWKAPAGTIGSSWRDARVAKGT